jgi:hypothetical protein
MIAALSLINTSSAQGDDTKNGRKPMQAVIASRMVAPALEKYAHGPLVALLETPGADATRPQHCYHCRTQPDDRDALSLQPGT